MRTLEPAPDAVVDDHGAPRFGSYTGSVPRVDLSAVAGGALHRLKRAKRWIYVGIATDDTYVALAIARLGYATNVFAYALDARSMRMLATRSMIAPPTSCSVGDGTSDATIATFRFRGSHARVTRPVREGSLVVDADLRGLVLRATLDAARSPPAITAIAPVGPSGHALVNTTEKRALLSATGELVIDGTRRALGEALAGYDYTNGLLGRRTAWRWAFGLGRATTGERVAFNLVQGFVGEPECALWVDGELFPLAEGRFAFDAGNPLSEWRVSTADGAVDLRFAPGGMHSEQTNLGILASRFVQPAGVFRGAIRLAGGRTLEIDRMLGVTEDQDVLW
jgi:hypothetical protein